MGFRSLPVLAFRWVPSLACAQASANEIARATTWVIAAVLVSASLVAAVIRSPAHAQSASPSGKSPIVVPAEIEQAERAYRRGEHDEARQLVDRYLEKDPKNARARFLRGLILIEQRQPDAAISAFSELAREQPELAEPHNNLAVLYAARGDYDKARDALQSALLANPKDPIALENLGDIHVRLAQRAYENALAAGAGGRALRDKLGLARELARGAKPPAGASPSTSPGTGPIPNPSNSAPTISNPSPTSGATQ